MNLTYAGGGSDAISSSHIGSSCAVSIHEGTDSSSASGGSSSAGGGAGSSGAPKRGWTRRRLGVGSWSTTSRSAPTLSLNWRWKASGAAAPPTPRA